VAAWRQAATWQSRSVVVAATTYSSHSRSNRCCAVSIFPPGALHSRGEPARTLSRYGVLVKGRRPPPERAFQGLACLLDFRCLMTAPAPAYAGLGAQSRDAIGATRNVDREIDACALSRSLGGYPSRFYPCRGRGIALAWRLTFDAYGTQWDGSCYELRYQHFG
jgi:hypothetical protein